MIVCVPVASVFKDPDLSSEYIDEVLFGETVQIIDENKNFIKIKTDYDYIGWTEKTNIAEKTQEPAFIVTAPFADLSEQNKYFYRPFLTVPRGARLNASTLGAEKRFAPVEHPDGKVYYIHKQLISPIEPNKTRTALVTAAKEYLGVQYRWGGRTPKGIDCSGLCFNAYRFCGINIWRDADITRSENLRRISLDEAKEGDLLFFKGHVAMYLGNGEIIHSSASNGRVATEKLEKNEYLKEIFICAGTAFNERDIY